MGSTLARGGLEGILLAPLEPSSVQSCQPFFLSRAEACCCGHVAGMAAILVGSPHTLGAPVSGQRPLPLLGLVGVCSQYLL